MNTRYPDIWNGLRAAYRPETPELDTAAIMAAVRREAAAHPARRLPPNPVAAIPTWACAAAASLALLASGAILAQYQKTADINLGTGMVIIGLASLIIGETIFGRGGIPLKVVGAVAGSVIYRFIIAVALRLNLPAECLKLISAVIVALAIALPYLRQQHKSRPRADRTERSV